jgi:hypothetical protein
MKTAIKFVLSAFANNYGTGMCSKKKAADGAVCAIDWNYVPNCQQMYEVARNF